MQLNTPVVNAGIVDSKANQEAGIVLTKVPDGLFLNGSSKDQDIISWAPSDMTCELRYDLVPGLRELNAHYPKKTAPGTGSLILNPFSENMSTGVYYCILVSQADPTKTSVEFVVIVQSSSTAIARSPIGNVNLNQGAPLFKWDPVIGVPYYFLLLSESPISIKRDEQDKIIGLSGLTLTWQVMTTESFLKFGDPDPSGNFANMHIPPLLPDITYNWLILNSYGPNPDLISSDVAPVAPSFFTVTRPTLSQKPVLLQPGNDQTITEDEILFEWQPVPDAVRYRLFLYEETEFQGNLIYYMVWSRITGDTKIKLNAKEMLVQTNYSWRIVAENSNGFSTSDKWKFVYNGSGGWVKFTAKSAKEGTQHRVLIDVKNTNDTSILLPVLTDTLGVVTVPLPEGEYTYVASKPGFLATPKTLFSVTNDTLPINFTIERSSTVISGRVVDDTGDGLFAAVVEIESNGDSGTTNTDESGSFVFALKPGNVKLRVRKAGYVTSEYQLATIQQDESLDLGEIQLTRASNVVSGDVTFSEDGRPLQGAFVRAQNGKIIYTTTTNNQGGYSFTLGPGQWLVSLNSMGYYATPTQYDLELTANQQVDAPFQLFSGGLLYGRIGFNGQVLENVAINAYEHESGDLVQTALTNQQGDYALGLQPGDYEITVFKQNYLEVRKSIAISAGQTIVEDFSLSQAGFVAGQVYNVDSNTPAAGVKIFALEDTTLKAFSDSDGNYLLSLPPDITYEIDAFLPGFESNGPLPVTTTAGETIGGKNFFLQGLFGIISGLVTDGQSPIVGAEVEIVGLDPPLKTDEDGRFEARIDVGQDVGLYTIKISAECYIPLEETVELEAGTTLDLTFELVQLSGKVIGRVMDFAGLPVAEAEISAAGESIFVTHSNVNGDFKLCLNSGIFRITAAKAGYFSADTTLVIGDGDVHEAIIFRLEESFATLSGVVSDTLGAPVPFAFVELRNPAQTLLVVTNFNGEYRINKIIAGLSHVRPIKDRFYSKTATQFLLEKQNGSLNLKLFPADGFIGGMARDIADSSGISDVKISATFSDDKDTLFTTTTDFAGGYLLGGLPVVRGSTYQVFAFKTGYASPPAASNVLAKSTDVNFYLISRSGIISGTVTDSDTEEPVFSVKVEAGTNTGSRSIAFTDTLGKFALKNLVPDEAYSLQVSRIGYFNLKIPEVLPGDTLVAIELVRKYGYVSGIITNIATAKPMSGVPVIAITLGEDGSDSEATTNASGLYMLRLVPDFYKIQPVFAQHRSDPAFVQTEVAEIDTVADVDFTLEKQQIASVVIQRTDNTEKPTISNLLQHCYSAIARDQANRPVTIGSPRWRLNVSTKAAKISADGCVTLDHSYFGDLTITAIEPVTGVRGDLTVQVFAPIDSATKAVLFDDRGLQLEIFKKSVLAKKELLVTKAQIAPAKKGRAEYFTTDFSYVIKPAGLVFDDHARLMLPPPPNTEGEERFIARWHPVKNVWELLGSSEANGLVRANILESGEYVALALSRPLGIDNLTLLPNPFSPYRQTDGMPGLQIAFDIASSAAPNPLLSVKIYNLEGNLVRVIHDQTPFRRGKSVINWDGQTDNGVLARNGRYLVRVLVEDPAEREEKIKSVVLIK